jgi:hypothetical protein
MKDRVVGGELPQEETAGRCSVRGDLEKSAEWVLQRPAGVLGSTILLTPVR